jgi:hypothetical protein
VIKFGEEELQFVRSILDVRTLLVINDFDFPLQKKEKCIDEEE